MAVAGERKVWEHVYVTVTFIDSSHWDVYKINGFDPKRQWTWQKYLKEAEAAGYEHYQTVTRVSGGVTLGFIAFLRRQISTRKTVSEKNKKR